MQAIFEIVLSNIIFPNQVDSLEKLIKKDDAMSKTFLVY